MSTPNTTHDDNATTWRDLADELTPQQIAEVEYCERENVPPGLATPQGHLNHARALARRNVIQAICADIAPPAEAVAGEVYDWEERDNDRLGRMYGIWSRDLGTTKVDVLGVQYNDAQLERRVLVYEADELTAQQARQLGAALIEAADVVERLSQ